MHNFSRMYMLAVKCLLLFSDKHFTKPKHTLFNVNWYVYIKQIGFIWVMKKLRGYDLVFLDRPSSPPESPPAADTRPEEEQEDNEAAVDGGEDAEHDPAEGPEAAATERAISYAFTVMGFRTLPPEPRVWIPSSVARNLPVLQDPLAPSQVVFHNSFPLGYSSTCAARRRPHGQKVN